MRLRKRMRLAERAVLEAVAAALPPVERRMVEQQLAEINHVQRMLDWTEVNFYRLEWGMAAWRTEKCFPRHDEFDLARARFRIGGRPHVGKVVAVSGRVFALVTRPTMRGVVDSMPEDLQVEVLASVLGPKIAAAADADGPVGEEIHGWQVVKPWQVSLKSSDYDVVATREGDHLVLRDSDASYWCMAHEDEAPRPLMARTLRDALEEALQLPRTLPPTPNGL